MTKDEVFRVIKRYSFLYKPIKNGEDVAIFYVGKRKQIIKLTDEVKSVFEIINLVYERESDDTVKRIIKWLLAGQSDVWIMQRINFSKNAYYARKWQFLEKIYACCVARGLVSFEEALIEEIA